MEPGVTRILVLQGANMNWLGRREPETYGTTTAAELDARLAAYAAERGATLDIRYTNVEGEAIGILYEAEDGGVDVAVLNPGGFSYAGHALRDCILGIRLPVVELHVSNHFARGITSVTAAAARGVILGFGIDSYLVALDAALRIAAAGETAR
jgi:3-dehydroquinate dehydratase-2